MKLPSFPVPPVTTSFPAPALIESLPDPLSITSSAVVALERVVAVRSGDVVVEGAAADEVVARAGGRRDRAEEVQARAEGAAAVEEVVPAQQVDLEDERARRDDDVVVAVAVQRQPVLTCRELVVSLGSPDDDPVGRVTHVEVELDLGDAELRRGAGREDAAALVQDERLDAAGRAGDVDRVRVGRRGSTARRGNLAELELVRECHRRRRASPARWP